MGVLSQVFIYFLEKFFENDEIRRKCMTRMVLLSAFANEDGWFVIFKGHKTASDSLFFLSALCQMWPRNEKVDFTSSFIRVLI